MENIPNTPILSGTPFHFSLSLQLSKEDHMGLLLLLIGFLYF